MDTLNLTFDGDAIFTDLSYASEAGSEYTYTQIADDAIEVLEYDEDGEVAASYVVTFKIRRRK